MEDFSQSRGDDDLFDDEIVPFSNPPSPQEVPAQLKHAPLEPIPPPPQVAPVHTPASTPPVSREPPFPGFNPRTRGRAGNVSARGGTPKKAGLADSKWATPPVEPKTVAEAETLVKSPSKDQSSTGPQEVTADTPAQSEDAADGKPSPEATTTPTGPSTANPRPPAVRGDRTMTGGVRKPKLTEEELTAKLAAAKERSQNLSAAHARAQADAADFEERERVANQRRARDRADRKIMEGEREKNRQRKMAGQGVREWDREKHEVDLGNGRGGRRANTGTGPPPWEDDDDLRMYEWHEDRGRGRGRGGRGGRGRGRGRGGFNNDSDGSGPRQHQPDLSAEGDFPALPGSTTKKDPPDVAGTSTPDKSKPKMGSSSGGGLAPPLPADGNGGGSWAEQVESSEELVAPTNKSNPLRS